MTGDPAAPARATSDPVSVEHRETDGVTVLRMSHGKANALDLDLCRALTGRFRALADSAASGGAAVLTGSGRIFSAGVDLVRLLEEGEDYTERFLVALTDCFEALFACPAPVVAALNGHAVAGGAILALGSDLRLAADRELSFGIPELGVGVPFPTIALEIVRFAAAAGTRDALVYRGTLLSGAEAAERGVIDELVPEDELLDRAVAAAARLAAIPRASFAATKKALRAPTLARFRRTAPEADPEIVVAWKSPEVRTAIAAHVERTLGKRVEGDG